MSGTVSETILVPHLQLGVNTNTEYAVRFSLKQGMMRLWLSLGLLAYM